MEDDGLPSRLERVLGKKLSRRVACKLGVATAVTLAGNRVAKAFGALTGEAAKSSNPVTNKPHIAVIGAGAFGGVPDGRDRRRRNRTKPTSNALLRLAVRASGREFREHRSGRDRQRGDLGSKRG